MLIPPKVKEMISAQKRLGRRCNLFLDLDNTLISSVPYTSLSQKQRSMNLPSHCLGTDYVIYERPGVQKFLDFIFKHFNVCVWSAATKEYVLFIVNNVILSKSFRKVHMIMHSEHCDMSRNINKDTPKDLSFLWNYASIGGYSKNNTFIVDDLPAVYIAQPDNCVSVPAFDVERNRNPESDNTLLLLREELIPLFNI